MKKNDIPYGVGVLVAKDGKFLCGLRKDTGEICGPGGHLEKDESPEQAAVRETREEFGITPKKLQCLGCLQSKAKAYLPTMVFLCTDFDGEPKTDSEEMVAPYYGFNDIADLERKDAKLYPAFEDSLTLLEDCINGRSDGGAGSGNWGHVGRPGIRGGSGAGGGSSFGGGSDKSTTGTKTSTKVKSISDLKNGDSITFKGTNAIDKTTFNAKVTETADDHIIATTDDGTKLWIDNDVLEGEVSVSKQSNANAVSDNSARVARMVKNMTPEERKLYDQAHEDSEKAVKMMNDTFQSNMDTWNNASEAVKAGKDPVTATAAAKNHTIPGASAEAQKAYDDIRSKEPQISKDMVDVANNSGSAMYGLDYSCKTGSSVANKIERKQEKDPSLTDTEIVKSMGDAVRYTQLTDHDSIASTTKKTVKDLQSKGYTVNEVDNKYQDASSDYKGVHIGAVSPSGQQIELQIHSKESMKVKETIHPMYDIARDTKTPQRVKKALQMEMHDISQKMATPKGIMDSSLSSWKK